MLSLVVKIPVSGTYSTVFDGELTITLPVAAEAEPVITSPTVNIPVAVVVLTVSVGATGVVPIAVDSNTACWLS